MDIKAEINWIHQKIDKVKDPSFVEKLKHLLQSINHTENSDASYNLEINKALEDISEGRVYSEDDARSTAKKWGRK